MSSTLDKTLTDKQALFVQEYLVDLNATQAAKRAGYSDPNIGRQLITKHNISKAIQKAFKKREKRTQITADRTVKELAKIAYLDPRKFFDENGHLKHVAELDDDTAAALAGMDVITKYSKDEDAEPEFIKKVKIADKLKALESLGKHQGIYEKDNNQQKAEVHFYMDLETNREKAK